MKRHIATFLLLLALSTDAAAREHPFLRPDPDRAQTSTAVTTTYVTESAPERVARTEKRSDQRLRRTAVVVMIAGQSADIVTTIVYGRRGREANPLIRGADGRPSTVRLVVVKSVLVGGTFLVPRRYRHRAQIAVGIAGAGAGVVNVILNW